MSRGRLTRRKERALCCVSWQNDPCLGEHEFDGKTQFSVQFNHNLPLFSKDTSDLSHLIDTHCLASTACDMRKPTTDNSQPKMPLLHTLQRYSLVLWFLLSRTVASFVPSWNDLESQIMGKIQVPPPTTVDPAIDSAPVIPPFSTERPTLFRERHGWVSSVNATF